MLPGLAASKSLPIRRNDSVSEAAANTITAPVPRPSAAPPEARSSPAPQPATVNAMTTAIAVRVARALIRPTFPCSGRVRPAPPRPWST